MMSLKKCLSCKSRMRIDEFNVGCTNRVVIEEHEACCFRLSTGFTAIMVTHAFYVHCKGEFAEGD
jgi:hypothetical protein